MAFKFIIIIFTSNLGIYGQDDQGRRILQVDQTMSYDQVSKRVRRGIEDYFKLQLGRPEILNRIGENIVVFDFIREDVASQILKAQVERIAANLLTEKKIELTFSQNAMQTLLEAALGNLENGGRGIGNIVESRLINPLARFLFDEDVEENRRVEILEINADAQPCSLTCRVS